MAHTTMKEITFVSRTPDTPGTEIIYGDVGAVVILSCHRCSHFTRDFHGKRNRGSESVGWAVSARQYEVGDVVDVLRPSALKAELSQMTIAKLGMDRAGNTVAVLNHATGIEHETPVWIGHLLKRR